MDFLTKIEKKVLEWFKSIPNLPKSGQKWLGDNIWWLVVIGAIVTGLSALFTVGSIVTLLSVLGTHVASYYVSAQFTSWSIVTSIVSLVFLTLEAILLFAAIQPLKAKQKKGWVLLFASWLVSAASVVINAILSLNIFGFIISIIFGAVWIAVLGYFLIQIHGQFAHVERSRGVKKAK